MARTTHEFGVKEFVNWTSSGHMVWTDDDVYKVLKFEQIGNLELKKDILG